MSITIRHATPNDAARIVALIDSFTASGILLRRTEEFVFSHAEHYIVAEMDGRVIGCVHLDEFSPSLSELRSFAVDPSAQGKGAGRALVKATEDLARVRGCVTLFAVSSDKPLFEKFGFDERHIPELDRQRSEVSQYKFVFAKDLGVV